MWPKTIVIDEDTAFQIQMELDAEDADKALALRWRRMRIYGTPLTPPVEQWVTEIGETV